MPSCGLGLAIPPPSAASVKNGYEDAPGVTAWGKDDPARMDSHSPGRPTYEAGDTNYALSSPSGMKHDLTQAGKPQLNLSGIGVMPFNSSAWKTPVPAGPGTQTDAMDQHGLSLDFHAVRDLLVRVGANEASGQSILIDTAGGLVVGLGADELGNSLTATFDGGVSIVIKPNKAGQALAIELEGDINIAHKGNFQYMCTGDWVTQCATWNHNTFTDRIFKQQNGFDMSLAVHHTEAVDTAKHEGLNNPSDELTEGTVTP